MSPLSLSPSWSKLFIEYTHKNDLLVYVYVACACSSYHHVGFIRLTCSLPRACAYGICVRMYVAVGVEVRAREGPRFGHPFLAL